MEWTPTNANGRSHVHPGKIDGFPLKPAAPFIPDGDVEVIRDKVLATIPHITGSLSMLGSTLIAIQVIKKIKNEGTKTYHSLMLLMAVVDFVTSFGYALGRLPKPQTLNAGPTTYHRYGTKGNEATCTAQAFVLVFGIAVAFLNVLLSCYFLAVIRWRATERTIRSWIFPSMAGAVVISLCLTLGLYFMNLLNYNPLFCFIAPNFGDCNKQSNGIAICNERSEHLRKLLYFVPLWTCIGLITMIQAYIVWTVYILEARSARWRYSVGESTQRERTKKVAFQSLLYLAGFYLAWTPFTIGANMNAKAKADTLGGYYLVAVLVVNLQPMQGFFNCWVYFQKTLSRHTKRVSLRLSTVWPRTNIQDPTNQQERDPERVVGDSGCSGRNRSGRGQGEGEETPKAEMLSNMMYEG